MKVPRASAQQILCAGCDDACKCSDDGTIRVDVGGGSALADGCCVYAQHIYVFGLCPGQELRIEREWRDECDPLWGPWITCGKQAVLTACDPETLLVIPGRYQILLLQEGCDVPELDPEHVRVQVTKVPAASASLRLQEKATCCCEVNHE